MKNAFLVLATLLFSTLSWASPIPENKRLCGMRSIHKIYRTAKLQLAQYPREYRQRTGDKFLHCTISCELTKKCNFTYGVLAGLIKEFTDLFTSGDASFADMVANDRGVTFGRQRQDCVASCKDAYP